MQLHHREVFLLQFFALFAILATTVDGRSTAQPSSQGDVMLVGFTSENKTPAVSAPASSIFKFRFSNSLTKGSDPASITPDPLKLTDQRQQLNDSKIIESEKLYVVQETSANHSIQFTLPPPIVQSMNRTEMNSSLVSSTPVSANDGAVDESAANTTVGITTSTPKFAPAPTSAETTGTTTIAINGTTEVLPAAEAQVQQISDAELITYLFAAGDRLNLSSQPANQNQPRLQPRLRLTNSTENTPNLTVSAFKVMDNEADKENVSSIISARAITTPVPTERFAIGTSFNPTTAPTHVAIAATPKQTAEAPDLLESFAAINEFGVVRQPSPTFAQSQSDNHDFHPMLASLLLSQDFEAHSSNSIATGNRPSWRRLFSFNNPNSNRKRTESSSSSGVGRQRSSVSAFLASRSRRMEKTWLPVNIAESLTNETWPRNEAVLVFEPSAESLKNINHAELILTVEQPSTGRLMPYVLYGKYETFNESSYSRKKLSESATTLLDVGTLPRLEGRLSFRVTSFIQNIVGDFSKIGTVRVSYFVRRQADFRTNNTLLAVQPTATNFHPILSESTFDRPYFHVTYAQ